MLEDEAQWMPDQKTLLVKLVPPGLGPPPLKATVATGPTVQETAGQGCQSSTYEARDTLTSPDDEDFVDHYADSQLAFVDTDSLEVKPFGDVDRYWALDPAYDGQHLFVTAIRKPYSYLTTYERFPSNIEVWGVSNWSDTVRYHIAFIPLAENVPIHGVRLGPRDFF